MSMIRTVYLDPNKRGIVHRLMTCECGQTTNSEDCEGHDWNCGCGRLYNAFGQEIAHPYGNGDEEYWEEELR